MVALLVIILIIVIAGGAMMWLNRQPKMTPASATGSMQGQLSPQTNPKH